MVGENGTTTGVEVTFLSRFPEKESRGQPIDRRYTVKA